MKTYIRLKLKTKGPKPSDIYRIMQEHDFVPTMGEYDFAYDWGEGREPDINEVLAKLDSVHNSLGGHDIMYEVTTSDPMFHIKEMGESGKPPRPKKTTAPKVKVTRVATPKVKTPAASRTQTARPKPAGRELPPERKCPSCGRIITYIGQYNKWYCYTCKKYL